jgi:hypothetical protein
MREWSKKLNMQFIHRVNVDGARKGPRCVCGVCVSDPQCTEVRRNKIISQWPSGITFSLTIEDESVSSETELTMTPPLSVNLSRWPPRVVMRKVIVHKHRSA